jgi:acetyl-CoA carboxylase biotin carboxyl carrier protein
MMRVTQRDLRDIQELVENSPYDEILIEMSAQRVVLRRVGRTWVQEITTLAAPTLLGAGARLASTAESPAELAAEVREGLVNVYPPLPGTFYRAPKPGAEPFVEVGTVIAEDTVIGIIETMKLMNPVRAGIAGEVAEICAANGTLMQTGYVLMRVRPLRATS